MKKFIQFAFICLLTAFVAHSANAEARDFVRGPYLDQSGNLHWFNSRKAYRKAAERRDVKLEYRDYEEKRSFVAPSSRMNNRGRLFGRTLSNFRSIRLSRSAIPRGGLRRVWRPRGSSVSGF